jgi:hypothetical protein
MLTIVTGFGWFYNPDDKTLTIVVTKHDLFLMTGVGYLEGKAYDVTTVIDLSSLAGP